MVQSLDWIKINSCSPWTGSKLIHLTLSSDLVVRDVISNPPIRTGLDSASPWTGSNCADLKSGPLLIVGFEILHHI
jgi:hypothetical protein